MTPTRIEYTCGARRAVVTPYGAPRMWSVECQTWTGLWRIASDRTSEHTTRRAAEQAAQAWCKGEQ